MRAGAAAGRPLREQLLWPEPFLRSSHDEVRRAVEWLANAERPVLMPGGGVLIAEAWEPLVALAEHLQLAV